MYGTTSERLMIASPNMDDKRTRRARMDVYDFRGKRKNVRASATRFFKIVAPHTGQSSVRQESLVFLIGCKSRLTDTSAWLNQRSQRRSYTWAAYTELMRQLRLEQPRIVPTG